MREIKFRAWDKVLKEMFDVYAMDWGSDNTIVSCHSDTRKYYPNEEMGDKIIFMQFTGLKDKNGKEIYEGDIVKYKVCDHGGYDERLIDETVVIEWEQEEDYSGFTQIMSDDEYGFFPRDVEVIGNIYENSNLLKDNGI